MKVVNRAAMVIKPRQLYVDWANRVASSYEKLEDIAKTGKVFLISMQDYNDQEKFLQDNYKKFFELELEAWVTDKNHWPENADFASFLQWFDFTFYALVIDFSSDILVFESYDAI